MASSAQEQDTGTSEDCLLKTLTFSYCGILAILATKTHSPGAFGSHRTVAQCARAWKRMLPNKINATARPSHSAPKKGLLIISCSRPPAPWSSSALTRSAGITSISPSLCTVQWQSMEGPAVGHMACRPNQTVIASPILTISYQT
jgi:hypothetical protein